MEHKIDSDLPGILVASFAGPDGRKSAETLAREIALETSLPTSTTCSTMSMSGTAGEFHDVDIALDQARNVARDRGAEIVVLGAVRADTTIDVAVANIAESGNGSEPKRARLALSESTATTGAMTIQQFVDDPLLEELVKWAVLLEIGVNPQNPPELDASRAFTVARLADFSPARPWRGFRGSQEGIKGVAFRALLAAARWHDLCPPALESRRFAPDASMKLLAELEIFVTCTGAEDTPEVRNIGMRALQSVRPLVQALSDPSTPVWEALYESPWSGNSEVGVSEHGEEALGEALKRFAADHPEDPFSKQALAAAERLSTAGEGAGVLDEASPG